jgi:hypothetical protein
VCDCPYERCVQPRGLVHCWKRVPLANPDTDERFDGAGRNAV